MEENPIPHKKLKIATEAHKPHVYVLRDWKEYLGESALIIFSVLLALVLTEYFNNLHDKKETRKYLTILNRNSSITKELKKICMLTRKGS
jgi:hypothetical protein